MMEGLPKIVYILPEFNPDTDSHFSHLYDLLNEAGGELDCAVIAERGSPQSGTLPPHYRIQRWRRLPLRAIELALLLARERAAGRRWFYVHYSFVGALAAWAVTRLAGGTVYYWNCGMPWLYRRPWLRERVFRFILRHTILVTGTPGMAEAYRRAYGLREGRIRALPNWIRTERYAGGISREEARRRLGIPGEARTILFVHRLSRRKGAHLIAEVARLVTGQSKRAMFLVVGDGPEREHLESGIMGQGLNIRLAGAVPNRGISEYFAAADVFFMPSEEEGFPHVLLEAMAAGIPYVASDVGGVREITPLELSAYLVPSGDAGGYAERIAELLDMNENQRSRMSAAERAWARRYDLAAVLPQFIALFTERS